jgi:ABC-2 type transport system permease protein
VGGLIRAEVRKLVTTQVWFWLLLASLALTAVGVIAQIAGTSSDYELARNVHDVFSSANSAYIAVFVLGVLAVTTEFRYQTITPTVLATPSRWRLIIAKLITYAVVGVVFALACVAVQLAIAVPWLSARNVDYSLGNEKGALLAVFTVVSLFALVGMGAGALLRNQIVAVSVGLLFILVLENLVVAIPVVKNIYPFLPAGGVNSISTRVDGDRYINGVHLLPVAGGVVVLLVWGLGMAVLGAGLTMSRDIS